MNEIITRNYAAPTQNKKECLRYCGISRMTKEHEKLLDDCLSECLDAFSYKVCYGVFPITRAGGIMDFGFASVKSSLLERRLEGCEKAVVFSATVGIEIDRFIAKYGKISPSRAVMMQGIGAERIEALCDAFCEDISLTLPNGEATTPRVSPGYSDFPLEFQKEIFETLSCSKRIGLYLNESLLMSPTKSVTAIVGIKSNRNLTRTGSKP